MQWRIEVIRYDGKGKKVVELDYYEAEAYTHDEHNNLILYNFEVDGTIQQNKVVKHYHAYNWISISPER